MRSPLRAQSILEYSMLIIVIAAGVVLMAPYVIRSTNAYLKSLEDSSDDSMNDPLVKAPSGTTPTSSCACDSNFIDQGCGNGGCSATSRFYKRFCSPLGCACIDLSTPPAGHTEVDCDECLVDDLCCTPWASAGNCGDPACAGDPLKKPMTRTCGSLPLETQCIADPSCQPFTCGGAVPANATICSGDDTGLTGQTFNSVVDVCTPDDKCEYTCDAGFENQAGVCVTPPAGPCQTGEVECFEVRYTGKWQADTWDKDDICTDDKCDPWQHCWGGNGGTVCGSGVPCSSSPVCGTVTAQAATLQEAQDEALEAIKTACSGYCAYKSPQDGSLFGTATAASCSSCCNPVSRETGATTYLCIGETSVNTVCVTGSSCP